MRATTFLIAFYPIEGALLEYYARLYNKRAIQILRGMVRKCALADPNIDTDALRAWAPKVRELAESEELMQEALLELEGFVARREGRAPGTPPETLLAYSRRTDLLSGAQFACQFTAFELLLLDFYASRAHLTRERTLRHFLRLYVLADKGLNRAKFQAFAAEIAQRLKKADRGILEEQLENFFAPRDRPGAGSEAQPRR